MVGGPRRAHALRRVQPGHEARGLEIAALLVALTDPAISRVIVDVRNNYGGQTFGYPPVVEAIARGRRNGRAACTC